jgi:hypothetical protein
VTFLLLLAPDSHQQAGSASCYRECEGLQVISHDFSIRHACR